MRLKLLASRISFDYDGVLSTPRGRKLAKLLIEGGATVYIITARMRNQSDDVFKTAELLGIKKERVIFTNHRDKWHVMEQYRIGTHYDNNQEQITKINEKTNTKGVLFSA
jgi:hypothetical protein